MSSFNDYINRLYALSSKEVFKREIELFLEFYDSKTVEFLDKEKREIVVMEKESEPPYEYLRRETSMAKELLTKANDFRDQPTKIIGNLDDQRLKRKIRDWIKKLERAELISSEEEYLKRFPEYFQAIDQLKNKLEELRLTLSLEESTRGRKSTLSTAEQVKIIVHAKRLLNDDPAEYSPSAGAIVSEKLKIDVKDELKSTIPKISKHKVARILLKHFRATKRE